LGDLQGILYVVATPIGNLEDLTLRGLETLKGVDIIAAEDTRRTRILLSRYDIPSRLISYRDQNREKSGMRILSLLEEGGSAALVTDAGTPGLSDPGFHLVRMCVEKGVRVVPVPGPSALASVISVSGMPMDRFLFEGFLPSRPKARRTRLWEIEASGLPFVCHESPLRIIDSLQDMEKILGDREIVVAREMTKMHEEFLRGRISEVAKTLMDRPVRGEFTVAVGGGLRPGLNVDVMEAAKRLLREGVPPSRTASILSELTGTDRRSIYRIVTQVTDQEKRGEHDG